MKEQMLSEKMILVVFCSMQRCCKPSICKNKSKTPVSSKHNEKRQSLYFFSSFSTRTAALQGQGYGVNENETKIKILMTLAQGP